ncbi:hypothetical protein M422DRAFT_31945 [Sphaerobolus stellatus SS14]|uniref:Uncharacterized protein n=1 Tax=Sphaerobolus stellatus (strain SS14) TaxID=990650 RepID=A0A0C9UDA2_SPHS4|nr:hypothetical protein M422DRAFT_31945 [Sphaerobolus stellatus SS14]
MLSFLRISLLALLLNFFPTILAQKLSLVTPSSTPQCGDITINWSGGVPPYSLTVSTDNTNFSNFSSVSVQPGNRQPSSDYLLNWPAGTPFIITVTDNIGNSDSSKTLTVQPSSNSTCIEDDDSSFDPNGSPSTGHRPSSSQTLALPGQSTITPIPILSPSNGDSTNKAHSGPSIALIAGIAAGVIIILVLFALLIWLKRRNDKIKLSSREKFVIAFGDDEAGLDAPGRDDIPDAAIPNPYMYQQDGGVNGSLRSHRTTMTSHRGSVRSATSSTHLLPTTPNLPPPPTPQLRTVPRKVGERYLPDFTNEPQDPVGPSGSNSRLHEEDIEQLAAKMISLMASGRMNDQAWSAAIKQNHNPEDEHELEEFGIPINSPPHYEDIAKGQELRTPVLGRRT